MALHFGAFITESSGHLSEYLPYYRTNEKTQAHYMREKYDGESAFYANGWPTWRKNADQEREEMITGDKELPSERSWEYGSWIIEAREKDSPFRIHGNVYNQQDGGGTLISNLPSDRLCRSCHHG
jgi:alpha-galactosidase